MLLDRQVEFELCGTRETLDGLIEELQVVKPNVLVLDYNEQDPSFTSKLREIKENTSAQILLITNDRDRNRIQTIIKMGIKGIVTKQCSKDEIVNSIHAVAGNNRFFCNKILDIVVEHNVPTEVEDCEATDLSPREYQVLQLITKGFKTSAIADELHVSVHTVNSHRKNILKKLRIKSPAQLIVYAMETGLVKA